ncbi:nitroreductase family protein [Yinghuangia aomiensis]
MRRVKPDPVPHDVQARILDAAVRAPSGGNSQGWRFLLVDSPEVKAQIGPLYREAMAALWQTLYAPKIAAAHADPDAAESKQFLRDAAFVAVAGGQLRAGAAVPVRLRAARSDGRLDLPGGVERAARGACGGRRFGADGGAGHRAPEAGDGHPRRAGRPGLAYVVLRVVRLSDGPVGGRAAYGRARGGVPQRLGCPGRLRDPRTPVAGEGRDLEGDPR